MEEFDHLLAIFSDKWRNYYRIHTIEGKRRNAPLMKPEKPTKSLPSTAEKLFFFYPCLPQELCTSGNDGRVLVFPGGRQANGKSPAPAAYESLQVPGRAANKGGHKVAGILDKLGSPLLSGRQRAGHQPL
ncbi:MAG: hypothetical protein R2825_28520 [Saprospiraceae bacterium]